jgi:hypothetical protein
MVSFPTAGGISVTLTGFAFGTSQFDAASPPLVTYGSYAPTCTRKVCCAGDLPGRDELYCTIRPGAGSGHQWRVTIAGQASDVAPFVTGYAGSSVSAVSPTTLLGQGGGETVNVTGANFGPVGTAVAVRLDRYTPSCSVLVAHTILRCTTVPGVGGPFGWTVTVSGVVGATSSVRSGYVAPTVTGVSGAALTGLSTVGGQDVTISGSNFGLFSQELSRVTVEYGPPSQPTKYTATNCVGSAGSGVGSGAAVRCKSAPGTGSATGFVFTLSTDGVTSAGYLSTDASYLPPDIQGMTSSVAAGSPLPTDGSAVVTFTGTNFGPVGDGPVVLVVGTFRASAPPGPCTVITAHTVVRCPVVGVGVAVRVSLEVAGLPATGVEFRLTFQVRCGCGWV